MAAPSRRLTTIYGLEDPRNQHIYYIGKSDHPTVRLRHHLLERTNALKVAWLASLREDGLVPRLVILARVPVTEWPAHECQWIAHGFAEGWPLTNLHPGGTGGNGLPKASPWPGLIARFLSSEDQSRFAAFTEETQRDICHLTALRLMDFSWIAIQQRGGIPEYDYDPYAQFDAAAACAHGALQRVQALRSG